MSTSTSPFLLYGTFWITLIFAANAQRPPVSIDSSSPNGWLVSDLLHTDVVTPFELLTLQPSPESSYFTINNKSQILVNKPLSELINKRFPLYFLASRAPFKRVVVVNVNVVERFTKFTKTDYLAEIKSNIKRDEEIDFGEVIQLADLSRNEIRYVAATPIAEFPIKIVNIRDERHRHIAKVYMTRQIRKSDPNEFTFFLNAFNGKEELLATTRVRFKVLPVLSRAPEFEPKNCDLVLPRITAHTSLTRVTASSNAGGVVIFRVEPESSHFDVSPLHGDIFSKISLISGNYTFNVVANDREGQETKLSCKISIVVEKLKRNARQLSQQLTIRVPEDHQIGYLDKMKTTEKLLNSPIVKDSFTVWSDGKIELTKPLNYEKQQEHSTVLVLQGHRGAREILLRLIVDNVDEPPAFVNGPKPYLAVVPLDRPIGFHVYKFDARDELGDGDSDVEYTLINTEPPGMFTVDSTSGVVRTAVKKYKEKHVYKAFIQARDKTTIGNVTQLSEVAVLEILAGDRPPQFAKQKYLVSLSEDNLIDYSVVDVRAHGFRSIDERRSKGPITYKLYSTANGDREESSWFGIDANSGIVHLRKSLDYDDPGHPKTHQLIVIAQEDGKEAIVPLEINIADINDNSPIFSRPLYTAQVKEDIPAGTLVLKVHADDKDSGVNAKIRYRLEDGNFTINEHGEISPKRRLDADQNKERFFIYKFNVSAEDGGNPSRRGTAMIHIRTENTNDEAPVFLPTAQYTAWVAEDAQGGTPVVQIQARDPDRDQVEYAFLLDDGSEVVETRLFNIDKDTGLIKLRPGVEAEDLLRDHSPYNLTVLARDDGSCCEGKSSTHTATATVLIGIEDVNNNKPEFRDCDRYSKIAKIKEGVYKKNPPTIIKVEAVDEDSSSNGQIVYSLYYAQSESRKPFIIDKQTGELKPSPHVIFDRETRPREEVTVKATDRGERPLIGFCQFTVEVVDVNDNAPQFDRASYETSVSRSETIGTSVVTVFAFDQDAPHNARITYQLAPDPSAGAEFSKDISYFELLNGNSGEITLINPIPKDLHKERFQFNVIATDKGVPEAQNSTVQVTIKIHEKAQHAPRWQSSPDCRDVVTIVENTELNKVLLRCHAVAGDGSGSSIVYKLTATDPLRGVKADAKFRQFSRIDDGREWVEVAIMETLDYEQAHNYTLTLTATDVNSQVSTSRSFTVLVDDANDGVPQFTVDLFTGTVDEELTPAEYLEKFKNRPITTLKAVDSDSNGPQNEVHYRILDVDPIASRLFRIDEVTGEIFPNSKFDREQKDMYILTIEARDNAPSSLPGVHGPNKDNVKVQIVIGDVNDNAPTFDEPKYTGRVTESAEPGHEIITVKAHDLDKHSNLRYDLTGAFGGRIPFGVRTDSGAIFVKEPLDYEKESVYQLRLQVSDGRHNTSTDVHIYVDDVNDNPPVFEFPTYTTTILEQDKNVPKVLFRVNATDADKDEKSRRIIYRLEGQGAGEFFRIGRETGEIELIKELDRDPPLGVATWKFIVQAVDDDGRGLIGYADVQVKLKDINDNAPVFPENLYGTIEENRDLYSRDGVYIMDVRAQDFDDPATDNARLEYSIFVNKELDGEPVFRIDSTTGKIFAMRKLDRELPSEKQFVIKVRATDKGTPPLEGFGNVTIRVLDKNDNAPYFERALYRGQIAETARVGEAVMSVLAFDPDDEAIDNVFTYTLSDDSNRYFYMTTDGDSSGGSVGVLRVKQPLDYEDATQRGGYQLEVKVSDGIHEARTRLEIELLDRNDHAPVIDGPTEKTIKEDAKRGHFIAKYTASDRDDKDTARTTNCP
ncbi:unnamed protein product, partial [Mesorhabditis belari]|uniref:Cadherin domain-containing protein n=1 Tax=Mesorhabditis belari TaxID=2138241 RepID=A0AAF3FEF7_9BILA